MTALERWDSAPPNIIEGAGATEGEGDEEPKLAQGREGASFCPSFC